METELVVDRQDILNVPVDSFDLDSMARIYEDRLSAAVSAQEAGQIVFLRLWDLMRARRDREYHSLLSRAALVVPVSTGIVRAGRFLKRRSLRRHMPFEVLVRLLAAAEEKRESVYLLGGDKRSLHAAEQALRQTFPGARFVGRYTGWFPAEMEGDIVTAIKKAKPSVLVVGRGVRGGPKWISRHRSALAPGLAVYAPDGFDVFAGRRRRTSRESFARGTEYLPDFWRRPWRLLRLFVYLWFLILLVFHRLRRR